MPFVHRSNAFELLLLLSLSLLLYGDMLSLLVALLLVTLRAVAAASIGTTSSSYANAATSASILASPSHGQ